VIEALVEGEMGVPRIGRALSGALTAIGLAEVGRPASSHRTIISRTEIPQTL
jgi:hypothetical protein